MVNNQEDYLEIYCDGGARGNPGPAAIGFVINGSQGEELVALGKAIGETTNNVAEYMAVVKALEWLGAKFSGPEKRARFYLDSLLVANQLNGLYKIKNARLRNLAFKVHTLEQKLRRNKGLEIEYIFVPREKNFDADALVNQALDRETLID